MKLAINGGNPAISEIIDDWKDIQKDDINCVSKYLDVKNEEVLYIGDTMNDVEFCKELNIPIIAVSYGYCAKDSFMETDVISISDTQNELINNINIYCNEKD